MTLSSTSAQLHLLLLLIVSMPSCRHVLVRAVKLETAFYDLFSLTHAYDELKYGDIPHLREAFMAHHLNENTARLLYALARAFTRSEVASKAQFSAQPYLISALSPTTCDDTDRYAEHRSLNVACHFEQFVHCVETLLEAPNKCLNTKRSNACPVGNDRCWTAYRNVELDKSLAWFQIWAEETTALLLTYRNYTARQIAELPRKSCLYDSQFLSAVFNLGLCADISRQASFTDPRILHPLVELYCPDPCLRNPCAKPGLAHQLKDTTCNASDTKWESGHAIAHRWDDLQLQRLHGVKLKFTCNCRIGQWEAAKQTCETVHGGNYGTCAPTLANKHFPCSAEGSFMCFDNKDSEEAPFICRCKEGFVGLFCQEKLDACVHTAIEIEYQGKLQKMTGNGLCNVNHGGQPILNASVLGNSCYGFSDSRPGYNCSCNKPYYRLINLQTDNCMGVMRACDSELCIHGDCAYTPDLITAGACRCQEGWGGSRCDQPMADWSVWTACWPDCGANRTRQRERLGDRQQPGRLFVESEACSDRYCEDDTDEAEYTAYQTLLFASCADSAALAGSLLLALLSFGLMRFWRPRFASRDIRSAM